MDALPEWIDREAWDAFQAMRDRIKRPMSNRAKVRLLGRLIELRVKGHDPNEALDQSEFHCWQDVYEPRQQPISSAAKSDYDLTQARMHKEATRPLPTKEEVAENARRARGLIHRRIPG